MFVLDSIKSIKKTCVSFALLGALLSSAHAYDANMVGNFGIGGFYSANNGDNAKLSNTGGYVSIGGMERFFSHKLQLGAITKIGYGRNLVNFNDIKSSSALYLDLTGKIGLNILTQNTPLFVNAIFGIDNFYTFGNKGISRELAFLGAELEGRIPLSDKTSILYGGGFSWIAAGSYVINKTKLELNSFNYFISATLGISAKLNDKLAFYAKAGGKYYGLNDSKMAEINSQNMSFPESKSWMGTFEIGFEF